ncbi:hypothetical protein HK102_010782, partial [Quaeritorhiza haematococci]
MLNVASGKLAAANETNGGDEEEEDPLRRAWADLHWIWGKFYLNGLQVSVERHATVEDDDDDEEGTGAGSKKSATTGDDDVEELSVQMAGVQLFDELAEDPQFRRQQGLRPAIPPKFARDFGEARVLFLEGLKCLEEAKRFFVLDGFVSDHIGLVQDMSQLYKCLAAFESDPVRK